MPEKILVIDDEKGIRESSVALLQRKGYDARGAASGEEALELIQNESFDLLLLDVRMPGMDGIEVLRRAIEIVPDVQVVMLTGHGTMDTAIEALEYGAIGFLRKPVTIDDLQISIEDAMARGNTRKENARLKALLPLFELNNRLLSELDEEKIVGIILETVDAETDGDHVEVTLWDENRDRTKHYSNKILSSYSEDARENSEDMKQQVSSTMKPIVYSTGDVKIYEDWEDIHLIDSGYEIYIPFVSRNAAIGVLKVVKMPPHKPLRESDIDFLITLCSQSSIAISNSRLYDSLEKAHLEVEDLLRRVIKNTEDERLRISLELHDGPIQSIVASQFSIQACRALLQENMEQIDAKLLATAKGLLESTHSLRRIVSDLHPPDLERSGLISAIQEYLSIIDNEGKIKCYLKVNGEAQKLKYSTERAIYYIVREAVTNSKKHAQASTIEVKLEFQKEKLIVAVRDDGVGFTFPEDEESLYLNHIGIRSINERAKFLQGELAISSKIGQGTTVQLDLPLEMHLQD